MSNTETKSLIVRLRQFFGQLPGQTFSDFGAEIKKLTPADRDWFVAEFNKAGMPTALVAPPVAA